MKDLKEMVIRYTELKVFSGHRNSIAITRCVISQQLSKSWKGFHFYLNT